MTQEVINNGSYVDDPTAEDAYTAFGKVNNNFNDLYPTSLGAMVLGGATSGSILELPAGTSAAQLLSMSSGASGLVPAWDNGPQAFNIYMTGTSPTYANSTWAIVPVNTTDFDTTGAFNTSTYQFTPTVAGYYLFNGYAAIPGSSAYLADLALYKNGTIHNGGPLASGFSCGITAIVYMNGSTDYIEMYYRQLSGSSQSLATGIQNTYLQGMLIK